VNTQHNTGEEYSILSWISNFVFRNFGNARRGRFEVYVGMCNVYTCNDISMFLYSIYI